MALKVFTDEIGTKYWQNENGKLHREDGPAVISREGDQYWYLNGKHHREEGPAVIRSDNSEVWIINGKHLTPVEVSISKRILSGELFSKIPLYINHPVYKYFCQTTLKKV